MTHFIINDRQIDCDKPQASLLLDYIRYDRGMPGTKIGCREGDCGACTVLIGTASEHGLRYTSMTSCLTPLANVAGKHIVTIEGLNLPNGKIQGQIKDMLTPYQQFVVDEGGTQCGFCTPGFIVSLAGFCLDPAKPTLERAIAAMDGNICRCTGYKSLERAASRLVDALKDRDDTQLIPWLVSHHFLPEYFLEIPKRLAELAPKPQPTQQSARFTGGGTDLYVQDPETLITSHIDPCFGRPDMGQIRVENGTCHVGGAVTAEQLRTDPHMIQWFPNLESQLKLFASTPIRNMATVAGNLVNASPIGDMTQIFLALGARIHLEDDSGVSRDLPLRDFYKGYKNINKKPQDRVTALAFPEPGPNTSFNFEKVSKRTYLDIASVNSAARFETKDGVIQKVTLTAGGVGPIPLYLEKTSSMLSGKPINPETVEQAVALALTEISPISDVRGSAEYKSLLLSQLIRAHFLTLFPQFVQAEALV